MGIPRTILEIATKQGGCVTRRQMAQLGMSESAIDRLVGSGSITHVHADMYRALPSTGFRSDLAAAVVGLPDAVVSHESAALLHGFPRIRKEVAVVTVHSRTTHVFPQVTVRRSIDLCPDHVENLNDLPITTPARTVVDLAGILKFDHLDDLVGDMLVARRIDLDEVARIHRTVARRGRRGTTNTRLLLEHRGNGEYEPTKLERLGLDIVRRLAIQPPEVEFAIPWNPSKRFDLAWPAARVAVEWDSRQWHGALDAMAADRARDRSAAVNGWAILRFTWAEVHEKPRDVGAEIETLVRLRLGS